MKAQARKARTKHSPGRKPTQSAPLTQMLVVDALRTWVIPTLAAAIGLAIFVIYNVGVVDEATALTVIGGLALLVVLFAGLRGFFELHLNAVLISLLATFAVLFGVTTFYPFYRALNPGTPVFSATVKRGTTVTLPLHDKPGHYSVVFEAHFVPVEGRQNRTAAFHATLAHDGVADRVFEGTFSQEWRSERVGAGRRSFVVPAAHENRQVREVIDDPEGRDLTLSLTDLSAEARDDVSVKVYAETMPQWLLIALGVLTLAGAVLIDSWRPKGANEGLMATLTAAALVSVPLFSHASATPGFPQLIIAVLVGGLVGALAGSLLWRLTFPLKKYLPAIDE